MSLLCKILGHKVETLCTNMWQIPTREGCKRCALIRNLDIIDGKAVWQYTDGRKSNPLNIMSEQDIAFGDIE